MREKILLSDTLSSQIHILKSIMREIKLSAYLNKVKLSKEALMAATSNQFKFIEKLTAGYTEEILTDYERAAELVSEKFNIETTADELKKCCTSNKDSHGFLFFDHKPKLPWTVEFPLDALTITSMQANLSR